MPVSGQCLFSKKGLPWDVLEVELKEEGWLYNFESLFEAISNFETLMRPHLSEIVDPAEDPFDDTWSVDDYENFYGNL